MKAFLFFVFGRGEEQTFRQKQDPTLPYPNRRTLGQKMQAYPCFHARKARFRTLSHPALCNKSSNGHHNGGGGKKLGQEFLVFFCSVP